MWLANSAQVNNVNNQVCKKIDLESLTLCLNRLHLAMCNLCHKKHGHQMLANVSHFKLTKGSKFEKLYS